MPYDFSSDIENLTRITVDPGVEAWAVDTAKTLYIADDPAEYDEDLSFVDNKLVALLASAFVAQYHNGVEFGSSFKLDEFSVETSGSEETGFFKFMELFWAWLRMYQARGISLQYADVESIVDLTVYDPEIYAKEAVLPEGITEN